MYLHGGHVTSWVPRGTSELLYCSPNTAWQDGRAIRGGIPVCFPWFGDKADDARAPAHGFVRTKAWELVSLEEVHDGVAVSMATSSGNDTRRWWPHEFRLVCRATFGSSLTIELVVSNIGESWFSSEEALHAYFRAGDAERVAVRGLDGTNYIDKVDRFTEKLQTGDVRFTGETDRVYLNTTHDLDVVDETMKRRIFVRKQTSENTVVWNPGREKSAAMSDLGVGEWKNFACVETANIGASAIHVAPGASRSMSLTVEVG